MDSLTQIVLGASVAGLVGIKPFGRKAIIGGALLGTLPDLDVFLSYTTAIDNFTFHRGFSHSLFVLAALSLFLYGLVLLIKPNLNVHKKALFLVIFLPLITHPLLDSFTSYGTQLLWPISSPPIAWSSVFVIDPIFTLPLLIAVIGIWFNYRSKKWQKVNRVMLLISCLYLALGQWQFWHIHQRVMQDPITKQSDVFISATPLNTYLWRVISYHDDIYYEAVTHAFDKQPLSWKVHTTGRDLLNGFNSQELQRLEWFSRGMLAFREQDNQLIATDLRIGLKDYYPFTFRIAKDEDQGKWRAIPSEKMPEPEVNIDNIIALFKS